LATRYALYFNTLGVYFTLFGPIAWPDWGYNEVGGVNEDLHTLLQVNCHAPVILHALHATQDSFRYSCLMSIVGE
jgi:hypothetical protein